MDIGSFIAALALGFVAGAIGRALVPNDAFEMISGWRSWAASTGLGLVGAVIVVAVASWAIRKYGTRRVA